jgi:RecA-family ATPase
MNTIPGKWDSEQSLAMDRELVASEQGKISSTPLGDPDSIKLEPRPWLVDGFLLKKSVTAIVAPGGTGKSSFALTLSCSIAAGTDVFGLGLRESTNVMLLSYEDDKSEKKHNLSFEQHNVYLPNKPIQIFDLEGSQPTPTLSARGLIDHLIEQDIGLLVIDPLSLINPADENSNSAMAKVIQELSLIARLADCAVLLVHHTGKNEWVKGNADMSRGAKALTDGCRAVKTLSTMTVAEAKRRSIDPGTASSYVQLSDAKQNYQASNTEERWFEIESFLDETGESVGVIVLANVERQEYWQKTAENVALRIVETFGEGRHPKTKITESYAKAYNITTSTVAGHFAEIKSGSIRVTHQDKEYSVEKTKDGASQRSKAYFEVSLVA